MIRRIPLNSIVFMFLVAFGMEQLGFARPIDQEAFYGTGLATQSLSNLAIGQAARREGSIRFRAKHTGRVTAIKFFWAYKNTSGYNLGNGGQIRINLKANDKSGGNIPSATSLATFVFKPNLPASDPASSPIRFAELGMLGNPNLEAGEIYHIHLENIDPDVASNWISINSMFHYSRDNSQILPAIDAPGWSMLMKYPGGLWQLVGGYAPIFVFYIDTNGDEIADTSEGLGYMEWWGAMSTGVLAKGQQMVRHGLRPSEDLTLNGLHISAGRYFGTDSLIASVVDVSGNTIGNLEYSASNFPLTSDSSKCPWGGRTGDRCHVWSYAQFSQPINLLKGQQYYLLLSGASDTEYRFNLARKGSERFGFPLTSEFSEGYTEISSNGGGAWTGVPMWGQSNRREGNMEFFFEKG